MDVVPAQGRLVPIREPGTRKAQEFPPHTVLVSPMAWITIEPLHGVPDKKGEKGASPLLQNGKHPVLFRRIQGAKPIRTKVILCQLVKFLDASEVQLAGPSAFSSKFKERCLLFFSSPSRTLKKKVRNRPYLLRRYRLIVIVGTEETLNVFDHAGLQRPRVTISRDDSGRCRLDGGPLPRSKELFACVLFVAFHRAGPPLLSKT